GYEDMEFNFGSGPGGAGAGGFRMDGGNFSDFFEAFFGARGGMGGGGGAGQQRGRRPQAQPGMDVEAEISITLEDALRGATRSIKLQMPAGVKSFDVKIPPGTPDGAVIRLAGQGQASPMGGPAGDLRLNVKIAPHPRFEVQGQNLITDLRLAPWEAALGAKVEVLMLEGSVTITVPAGAQSGQKVRIKGKGLPRRGGEPGDLYVQFQIVVPKVVTDEEREAFEKLKEVSTFKPRACHP
ncbi:MAG: J domain-containing protein, partial [Phycisphaeraceae bacterium]